MHRIHITASGGIYTNYVCVCNELHGETIDEGAKMKMGTKTANQPGQHPVGRATQHKDVAIDVTIHRIRQLEHEVHP